jgi:hypothetical protein
MPLAKIASVPGVNKVGTALSGEGSQVDADKARLVRGTAETFGGCDGMKVCVQYAENRPSRAGAADEGGAHGLFVAVRLEARESARRRSGERGAAVRGASVDDAEAQRRWLRREFERTYPWIERALARQPLPTHTMEHVWEALASGNCVLWPTANAAAVVEIVEHPTGLRTLHHWLAGGRLAELQETERAVAAYARAHGYAAVTIAGRAGWERALPGYRRSASLLVKDLR